MKKNSKSLKTMKKTIYLLELVQLNTILLKLLWLCGLDPIEKNGIEGLKSQIGKHRGPNKGRPKGSCKPKTTIEELQRENLKLQVEIERLKKGYLTKVVGAKKKFISINNKNFKSLKN